MSEVYKDGSFVVDTPEDIEMYRLLTIASGLALEINTGMAVSSRFSLLATVQQQGLTSKRTKKGALKDVCAHIKKLNPAFVPNPRVAQAMA